MTRNARKLASCLLGMAVMAGPAAQAADGLKDHEYLITVTNVTKGESFTPILTAVHAQGIALFEPGQPASPELAALAEGGATAPLAATLDALAGVSSTSVSPGLLGPGESKTISIRASGRQYLSMAAMLIPTNDAFFSIQGVPLKPGRQIVTALAYDAGSEPNDELCVSIPGPACGGEGESPGAGGEGFVHVHSGIHGQGDLDAARYDWNDPVARIVIERARD